MLIRKINLSVIEEQSFGNKRFLYADPKAVFG